MHFTRFNYDEFEATHIHIKSSNLYQLIAISNCEIDKGREGYEPTAVYANENGRIFSKSLTEFNEKFEILSSSVEHNHWYDSSIYPYPKGIKFLGGWVDADADGDVDAIACYKFSDSDGNIIKLLNINSNNLDEFDLTGKLKPPTHWMVINFKT